MPGQYYDAETGLHYNQQRYYDPQTGQYLRPDPLGLNGGYHTYNYAGQNPLVYVDPEGEFIFMALAVISIAMTAYDVYDTVDGLASGRITKEDLAAGYLQDKAIEIGLKAIPFVGTGASLVYRAAKKTKLNKFVKKSCCFVAGTQVLTEDGYKNIEEVKLGEKLWAKNVETGEQEWKPVTKIFVEPDRGIYEIKLKGQDGFEQTIEATDDHPFYVVGQGWKTTIELAVGDSIETDGFDAMTVTSVIDQQREDLTYNFTVEDFHTYYVTKRNVLVHNCGDVAKKAPSTKERALDLKKANGDKNRVTIQTSDKKIHYDLDGATHKGVETPHIQNSYPNTNPKTGEAFWNKDRKNVESMTQQDIRTVRRYLERKNN